MKAQVDENISPALARALDCLVEDAGHRVVHVTTMHARGTADTRMLSLAGQLGVDIHVTHDYHHKSQDERDAIVEGNLLVFILSKSWSPHTFFEKASRLIHWWPRILAACVTLRRPGIYIVPCRSESWRFERVG